jgi:hypothetical protein
VVAVRAAPDWHRHAIHTFRISSDQSPPTTSAYTWELLAICMALLLRHQQPTRILSDCQSIIKHLCSLYHSSLLTPDHQFLLSAARNLLTGNPLLPGWIKSHPENQNSFSTFTPDQWAIYLADAIATDNQRNIHQFHQHIQPSPQLIHHDISPKFLFQDLQRFATWFWTSSTDSTFMPSPLSLRKLHHYSNLKLYTSIRDAYFPNDNLPSWQHKTYQFSSRQNKLSSLSIPVCAASVRLILDKGHHGRNRAKSASATPSDLICPLCQQPESLDHIVRFCTHPSQVILRNQAIDKAQAYINKQPSTSTYRFILSSILRKSLYHPDGLNIWLGTWTPSLIQSLQIPISVTSISSIRSHIYSIGQALFGGAWSLNANSIIYAPRQHRSPSKTIPHRPTSSRSPRINSYFQSGSLIRSDPTSSQLTSSSMLLLRRSRQRLPLPSSQPSIESFFFTDLHPHPDIVPPILIFHPP